MNGKYCEVHFDTLTSAPYNLVLDEQIFVVLTANNVYGDSDMSDPTFSGLVQLVPDPPVNLQDVPAVTNANTIKFTWDDAPEDGGSPVLDYAVYWDQGSSIATYVQVVSGLTVREYQTPQTLTPGMLYSFKVTSRNSVGESLRSEELQIYAADEPDAPT